MFRPIFENNNTSFTPLFRLLDDFETYNRDVAPSQDRRAGGRVFTPKFDMRETDTSFELHGELPGIDKEHISIDFTDPQTIVIKGKVERSYEAGAPPAGLVMGQNTSGVITEAGEEDTTSKSHRATVEDVPEEGEKQEVVRKSETKEPTSKENNSKFWYSERSVGQFSRTFGFPSLVDQESVSASLKDGVLNISVPKATKPTSRRIAIQ